MGEADRDWNPLENRQPSPIWTSLPQAKLSSLDKATDVNSSALRLLPRSLPPWGRELRPTMGIKWRILIHTVRNVTAQRWLKSLLMRDLRWAAGESGVWSPSVKFLGGFWCLRSPGKKYTLFVFHLEQVFPGLEVSQVRRKKKPKPAMSQLLKDSWEKVQRF